MGLEWNGWHMLTILAYPFWVFNYIRRKHDIQFADRLEFTEIFSRLGAYRFRSNDTLVRVVEAQGAHGSI